MRGEIVLAFTIRILLSVFTRTYFQPDEYYQALEPAHLIVFGYGKLTWEWLNESPIRSIVYPALNTPIFGLARLFALEGWLGDLVVITGPRILHGTLAALTDIATTRLARRVLGEKQASIALFLSLASFFNTLSLSRSLSNSLETSLTAVAFSYFPWVGYGSRKDFRMSLLFAAFACAVRPTNAVIWVFVFGSFAWKARSRPGLVCLVTFDAIVIAFVTLSAITFFDSMYYRKWVFTPLNFLRTNMSPVSLFYGTNVWHFYLSQALPILCTTTLPFVIHGIWSAFSENGARADKQQTRVLRTMAGVVFWTIGVYSTAGHKEWRFIHPLLPLLCVLATKSLYDLHSSHRFSTKPEHKPTPQGLSIRTYHLALLLVQIPLALFVVFFYNSAPLELMAYFRALPPGEIERGGVGFLMPCHSTPGQAYLHRGPAAAKRMWELGCEPPLGISLAEVGAYRDQTDIFFDSPLDYLKNRFPPAVDPRFPSSSHPFTPPGKINDLSLLKEEYPWKHHWPKYLALYGHLLKQGGVREYLTEMGYLEARKFGRDWEGEDKRKGGIRVWVHG